MAPISAFTLPRQTPQPALRPLQNGYQQQRAAVRFGADEPRPTTDVPSSETPEIKHPGTPIQTDAPIVKEAETPAVKEIETPSPEVNAADAKAKAVPVKKGFVGRIRDSFGFVRTSWNALKSFVQSDNATVATGLFLKKGVPLLFSMAAFVPVWGTLLAIAGIPLSYLSGRMGEKVLNRLKERKDANLSDSINHMRRIDELLDKPELAKSQTELIDTFNKLIDDALDVSKFPGLQRLVNLIRPTPNNAIGKLLKHYQQFAFMANINTAVAEAKTPGEAVWKGMKGGFSYIFYFKIMYNLGKAIEKGANFAPGLLKYVFKFIGWAMEYAGLIKMAADTVLPGSTPEPKKA